MPDVVPNVVVVTGAAGDMGLACAKAFARSADIVLLTDINAARLAAAEQELVWQGATTHAVVGDLADPSFPTALAQEIANHGRLRSLIHTAGLSPTMAGWQDILSVDLVASARLLDALTPLVTQGTAAVCLASIAGHMGAFDQATESVLNEPLAEDFVQRFRALSNDEPDPGATYRLAKRGVITLCERAAVTWGAHGGRVLSVSPGLINTEMGRLELDNNPIKEWLATQTPVGAERSGPSTTLPGMTADIANVVEFLCSPRAAFISGCDVRVDGGLVGALNSPGAMQLGETP